MLFGSPILQTFIAVVECGTVHAAAKKLHVTQTAVTQRIKRLEESLGVDVFIRTKKGMRLNSPGKVLLGYARKMEKISLAGRKEITGLGDLGNVTVTISASTTIMESRILPAIIPVLETFPKLYLNLEADDNPRLEQKLKNFTADIIICEEINMSNNAVYKKLKADNYVLLCNPGWKKRKLIDIITNERIIDYHEEDNLTFNYLQKYKLLKYAQRDRIYANRTELIAQMIEAGLGYSVLSESFAKSYIAKGSMHVLNRGDSYEQKLVCAWSPQEAVPGYLQAVIEVLA